MGFTGVLAIAGAVVGGIVLVAGLAGANGAPQEAAIAASAVAIAVLPYVLFRVLQINADAKKRETFYEEVRRSLDILEKKQ